MLEFLETTPRCVMCDKVSSSTFCDPCLRIAREMNGGK